MGKISCANSNIYGSPNYYFRHNKTISNNIALSLGMIGALSIVRFRHPVKSPLELVIYFALITVGIATSVRTKWAIQLIIATVAIILFVKLFQILSKNLVNHFTICLLTREFLQTQLK